MPLRPVFRDPLRDVLRDVIGGEVDPIVELFSGGVEGGYYDPSDDSTVFQDAAMTTPAGADDPVGAIMDKSGNGNHAVQASATARPIRRTDGTSWWLEFDASNDILTAPNAITIAENFYWGCGASINTRGTSAIVAVFSSIPSWGISAGAADSCGVYQRSDIVERLVAALRIGSGTFFSNFINPGYVIGTPFTAEAYHESGQLTSSNTVTTNTTAAVDPATSANKPISIGGANSQTDFYGGVCIMRALSGAEKTTIRDWITGKKP